MLKTMVSMLECRHSSVVENLLELVDNFNLHVSKKEMVAKKKTMKKEELFTNGVFFIVSNDEFEIEDGPT